MAFLIFWIAAFVFLLVHDHNRQMLLEQGMTDFYKIEYRHPTPSGN